MHNGLLIDERDNVLTVIEPVKAGDLVTYHSLVDGVKSIEARTDIPIYHKISIKNVDIDEPLIKYGETIGFAVVSIIAGDHVHTHNIEGRRNC